MESSMSVQNLDVVDGMVIDEATGHVVMAMYEERDWTETSVQLRDLEGKINSYLAFALGGQLHEHPEYRDKPIEIELYCQFMPPEQSAHVFQQIAQELSGRHIGFKMFLGPNRAKPLHWF